MAGRSWRPGEAKVELSHLLWVAICALVVALPLAVNFKRHDNHLDRTNHNYGLNMLMTVEPHSYLMTEGGDNQVFALAYLTMVEKMRPDLSIHDQKGNVFINPYGDMARMTSQSLAEAKVRANTKIVESGRPVYLTWRWRELYECGPYYYRQYGIMYKVQPIRYFVVDVLRRRRVRALDQLLRDCNTQLGRKPKHQIDVEFLRREMRKLQEEGLVRLATAPDRNGRMVAVVQFMRDYPQPYPGKDYWDYYIFDWNVPNSRYWDYLMREIIVNYNFQRGDIYGEIAGTYAELANTEPKESARREYTRLAAEAEKKAMACYERSMDFGHDMTAIRYNRAILSERRGDWLQALSNYRAAIEIDEELFQAYDRIANGLLARVRHALDRGQPISAAGTAAQLDEAEGVVTRGLDVADYYYDANDPGHRRRYPNGKYPNGKKLMKQIRALRKVEEQEMLAAADRTGNADIKLAQLYEQIGLDRRALEAYRSAIREAPNYWFGHFRASQILDRVGKRDEALAMLRRAVDLKMAKPNVDSLRLFLHYATYLDDMGRDAEALREYERLLREIDRSGHALDLVKEREQTLEHIRVLKGGQ